VWTSLLLRVAMMQVSWINSLEEKACNHVTML